MPPPGINIGSRIRHSSQAPNHARMLMMSETRNWTKSIAFVTLVQW